MVSLKNRVVLLAMMCPILAAESSQAYHHQSSMMQQAPQVWIPGQWERIDSGEVWRPGHWSGTNTILVRSGIDRPSIQGTWEPERWEQTEHGWRRYAGSGSKSPEAMGKQREHEAPASPKAEQPATQFTPVEQPAGVSVGMGLGWHGRHKPGLDILVGSDHWWQDLFVRAIAASVEVALKSAIKSLRR